MNHIVKRILYTIGLFTTTATAQLDHAVSRAGKIMCKDVYAYRSLWMTCILVVWFLF